MAIISCSRVASGYARRSVLRIRSTPSSSSSQSRSIARSCSAVTTFASFITNTVFSCAVRIGAALEIRPGCVGAKQLALDMDGEIADPAGHPDEVLVRAYRPVDQHDGRRPRAVLVPELPSQLEEHDGEVRVDSIFGPHPVDQ